MLHRIFFSFLSFNYPIVFWYIEIYIFSWCLHIHLYNNFFFTLILYTVKTKIKANTDLTFNVLFTLCTISKQVFLFQMLTGRIERELLLLSPLLTLFIYLSNILLSNKNIMPTHSDWILCSNFNLDTGVLQMKTFCPALLRNWLLLDVLWLYGSPIDKVIKDLLRRDCFQGGMSSSRQGGIGWR